MQQYKLIQELQFGGETIDENESDFDQRHPELYFTFKKIGMKNPIMSALNLEVERFQFDRTDRRVDKHTYLQNGGGSITYKDSIFGNRTFGFIEYPESHSYFYPNLENDGNAKECIILIIPKPNAYNECEIHSITNDDRCWDTTFMAKGHGNIGSKIVEFALRFIKVVLKPKYNLKIATLKDNSRKFCSQNNISLADMYFLLYGGTWYGKFGFRPYNSHGSRDGGKLTLYNKNYVIFKTKTVKDVKHQLIDYITEFNDKRLSNKFILDFVEKRLDMKLSDFLKLFLKHFEFTCPIFAKFCKLLMTDIGMFSFEGSSFFLEL